MRHLNLNKELTRILDFIRGYLDQSGFSKLILGLSGGIDSAVSAALAVKAIGSDNVNAILMPYKNSHPDSQKDAEDIAKQLGVKCEVVDITPMTDAYFDRYQPEADALRRGNWMARTRMCVLYDLSAKYHALVVGTSNRTELLVGYFTQYGDSACALEPIGHLYKSEVWALATLLDIPEKIIRKTPTADLWKGQTDEAELGFSYLQLDNILYALTELDLNVQASETLDYPREAYLKVEKMMQRSAFKRNPTPIPEL